MLRSSALLSVLVVAGCAASVSPPPPAAQPAETATTQTKPPASGGLRATAWRLEDIAGTPAAEGIEATLEFPEAGRVAGRGSCNRFSGTVEISGQSIKLGPLAATKMSCPGPADAQEIRYLQALSGAERFALEGGKLQIYSRGMEKPLVFAPR